MVGAERPRRPTVTCPKAWGSFPNGPSLVERMEAAGLREVRYYPLTGGIATLYVGVKRMPNPIRVTEMPSASETNEP